MVYAGMQVDESGRVSLNTKTLTGKESLEWPEGECAVLLLTSLVPTHWSQEIGLNYYSFLSKDCYSYNYSEPTWKEEEGIADGSGGGFFSVGTKSDEAYVEEYFGGLPSPTLKIQAGQQNHLKITLPKKFLTAIRKKMAETKMKTKPQESS